MADDRDLVMDMEANHFAMCLLMPEKFLRADIAKLGGIDIADDVAVEKLAKRYQVPVAMMALRLGQLMGRRMIPSTTEPLNEAGKRDDGL